MKSNINAVGKLTITPETEMESYALRCWFLNHEKLKDTNQAVLCVEDIVVKERGGDEQNDNR